jgi:hypothetical protein
VSFAIEKPGDADVYFSLEVKGNIPLRTLRVNFWQSTCHYDPKSQTASLNGNSSYSQFFDSYLPPPKYKWGDSQKPPPGASRTPTYKLSNDRGVFSGTALAINGSWESIIKFRRMRKRWGWRTVIFKRTRSGVLRIVDDTHNHFFPAEELKRPILPLTKDDCTSE